MKLFHHEGTKTQSKAIRSWCLGVLVVSLLLKCAAEDGIQHSTWAHPAQLTNVMPHWSTWAEILTACTNRAVAAPDWPAAHFFGGFPFDPAKSNHSAFHAPPAGWLLDGGWWIDGTRASGGDLAGVLQTNSDAFPVFSIDRLQALGVTNLQTSAVLVGTKNAKDWRALLELMRAVELGADVFSNQFWAGTSTAAVSYADAKASAESNGHDARDYLYDGSWSESYEFIGAWWADFQRQKFFIRPAGPGALVGAVDFYVASDAGNEDTFYGYGLAVTNWQKVATQTGVITNMVFEYGSAAHAPDWGADGTSRGYWPRFKLLFRGTWNP